jgi:uncharacterized protein YkwD
MTWILKAFFGTILALSLLACGGGSYSAVPGTAELASYSQTKMPAPTYDLKGNFKLYCQEARFVVLLNMYRASQDKASVAVSKAGTEAARWHGADMIAKNYFDHFEPDGRSPFARMAFFGYPGTGENIAWGSAVAETIFCLWKNSPGHNANMLSDNYQTIGIGLTDTHWSNGFGPTTNDTIAPPLTVESGCVMPASIPSCS